MGETTFRQLEGVLADATERYIFRLYVTGASPRSGRAICNVKALCEQHLPGRYDLEIIDIYQQPSRAEGDQVVATPTLVKCGPLPQRHLVGDLSDVDRVLMKLDLRPRPEEEV